MRTLKEICQDTILSNFSLFSNINNVLPEDQIQELKQQAARKVISLLQDKSVCKKYSLEELHSLISDHLSVSQKIKKEFFLALKKIEVEIMHVTANPLFRSHEANQLKIDCEQMQTYLAGQFGIAGYFHGYSVRSIVGYNGDEARAEAFAPLVILEKMLQQGLGMDALLLINRLFRGDVFYDGFNLHFEFKDNHLCMSSEGNEVTVNEFTETLYGVMHSYSHTPQEILDNAVNKILGQLKEVKDRQVPDHIREVLTQKQTLGL